MLFRSCHSPGNCYHYGKVKIDGEWVNACCEHFTGYYSCEDDCDNDAEGLGLLPSELDMLTDENLHEISDPLFSVWLMQESQLVTKGMLDETYLNEIDRIFALVDQTVTEIEVLLEDGMVLVARINRVPGKFYFIGFENQEKEPATDEAEVQASNVTLLEPDMVQITPNPANSAITITVDDRVELKSIAVFRIANGQRVLRLDNVGSHTTIEFKEHGDTFRAGYYSIRIEDAYGNFSDHKVLIQ